MALFLIATFASVTLTPLVRRGCERVGWMDVPRDGRRVHRRAVPRLGGVALFASVFVALAALAPVDNPVARALDARRWELFATLVPAALVFLFGVYDDLRGAGARAKFAALAGAGALFYALGGRVEVLSVPWAGAVELPAAAGFALTVVWMVGVANAFNLIDGLDGLAAGAALFASLVMLVVALLLGQPAVAVVACVLCGALVGFLRYNFNPASIFLGDSGALFIGFMLAALSVLGAQKASTAVAVAIPLLAFGVPVVDTAFTLVRRFLSGRPLFEGDREHIHHMLLARGWSQRRAVFVLYGASALFGLAALVFVSESGRATGLLLFIIAACVVLAVGRLRYHEVDELRASVRRNVSGRRLRAANHIGVRRATRRMSQAASPEELFAAVRELLELGEFVYARVQLGRGGAGALEWAWERGDTEAALVHTSGRFWTLRLPLATERGEWGYVNLYRGLDSDELLLDINYLCHLFQRETAHAAERILTTRAAETAREARAVVYSEAGI
ncbi:MAG TPA: MraY family glycosyltransferase [Pyrinomonadaceae bacterium]|nr:MraY family glycosyltransferase [Pyrinomonadaceae bacterium]